MRAGILLVPTMLLALGGETRAEPKPPDGWEGMKEGSWVVVTTTYTSNAGSKKPQIVSLDERLTLVKRADGNYGTKFETKSNVTREWEVLLDGETSESDIPDMPPSVAKGSSDVALSNEKLGVEGVEYSCKKETRSSDTGEVITTWTADKVGILKEERKVPAHAMSSTRVVMALAKRVKVAGKDVACREETETSKYSKSAAYTVEVVSTQLESAAVPRKLVRREVAMRRLEKGRDPLVVYNMLAEVTAFEVK